MTKEEHILNIITTIRESFTHSVEVYTEGSCYKFYLILKSIFPEAVAYYNSEHVITLIEDKYYDITGIVESDRHIPLHNDELVLARVVKLIY